MKPSLLLLALIAIGCKLPTANVEVKDLDKSTSVVVKDLRPESEKVHEFFSLMITSDAYGIAREGDARTEPPPVRLLQHRAFEKLGGANQPLNLTVYHFVTYTNGAATFRRGAIMAGVGGAIGAGLAPTVGKAGDSLVSQVDRQAFEALANAEFKRGLYTEAENPSKASMNFVYLDADINGKRTFIRVMAPQKSPSNATSSKLTESIARAMDTAIQSYLEAY